MHVITHGAGCHRGQVSAVMLLNSVTPPKDGFTTYLQGAEARAGRLDVADGPTQTLRKDARAWPTPPTPRTTWATTLARPLVAKQRIRPTQVSQ